MGALLLVVLLSVADCDALYEELSHVLDQIDRYCFCDQDECPPEPKWCEKLYQQAAELQAEIDEHCEPPEPECYEDGDCIAWDGFESGDLSAWSENTEEERETHLP